MDYSDNYLLSLKIQCLFYCPLLKYIKWINLIIPVILTPFFKFLLFIKLFFIENIGAQVSSVQPNETSSAHCFMCPSPQAKSLSVLIFLPFVRLPGPAPFSLWPPPRCCLCPWVIHVCPLANPFTFFHQFPNVPSPQLSVCSMCPRLCFHFVHQFSSFIGFHI